MSQPILTAMLALTIATILTATIAIVAAAHKRAVRAIKLTALAAIIPIAAVALHNARLRINFTASMPIGIYSLTPLPPRAVKRGMLVAACAPARAEEFGRQRGYLTAGPCAADAELLLKVVAAVAGDEVLVTSRGVAVNGCALPHSRALPYDRSGRRLMSWASGSYRLEKGEILLYAPDLRSWDSRYWGPAAASGVVALAIPLLVTLMNHPEGIPVDCRQPTAIKDEGNARKAAKRRCHGTAGVT
jgi:conjugative transfer signal peptidase TraF